MHIEIKVLALAALWQIVQFCLMAVPVNREVGTEKTLSSRDADDIGGSIQSQVSKRTARLIRALENHFQALLLFAIAVLVVVLSDSSSAFTQVCAWVYLIARIIYVAAYAFDWVPWRTVIWGVGFFATTAMLVVAVI